MQVSTGPDDSWRICREDHRRWLAALDERIGFGPWLREPAAPLDR